MSENLEIELRYKVKNIEELVKKLESIGARLTKKSHIIDHWYIPNSIKSREQHDVWFDEKRGCGIRIREEIVNGNNTTKLETKTLTKDKNHNTFDETETKIDTYENGDSFLKAIKRKEFLTIDKKRLNFEYEDFVISIDDIANYGVGIEIEYKGTIERKLALRELKGFANKLGLKEKDTFDKSPTVEAMKTLARFI